MYLQHFSSVTKFSQKCTMPSQRWSKFIGFHTPLSHCFSSFHNCSIGLMSGDSAGVCHQLMPFSTNHFFVRLDVCFGSKIPIYTLLAHLELKTKMAVIVLTVLYQTMKTVFQYLSPNISYDHLSNVHFCIYSVGFCGRQKANFHQKMNLGKWS